jgi:glycosyltransferase involved in cell wall biosynthesis
MLPHIIHVSNLSLGGTWFSRLLSTLDEKNFSQCVVNFDGNRIVSRDAELDNIAVNSSKGKTRFVRYLEAFYLIGKARVNGKVNFLFAQGHEESIICSLAARLYGLEFGVVHHVQPRFFPELKHLKPLKGVIHFRLYKYYIRRAFLIQSLSIDVKKSLENLGVENRRIIDLAHGINFEVLQEKIKAHQKSPSTPRIFPTFLMVGRLSWEKNYTLALETFKILVEKFDSPQLLIAGIGPMENELGELINKYHLQGKVKLLGYVTNIPSLMIEADALIHFAVTESYGQVYIEAAVVDLPIISPRVGIVQNLEEQNSSEILLLKSSNQFEIADDIFSFSEQTLKGRKKKLPNPQNFSEHDETYVFNRIGDYLDNCELS